jgi:hypothetical protein
VRPMAALQMQGDLGAKIRGNSMWEVFANSMLSSMEAARTIGRTVDLGAAGAVALTSMYKELNPGKRWVEEMLITLSRGRTYIVAEHMNPLIRMAAADYPRDIVFTPDMVPAPDGFMVFDRPWESRDVRGVQGRVKVITWSTGRGGGVHVNEFTSILEPDEITMKMDRGVLRAMTKDLGPIQLHHSYELQYGSTLSGLGRSYADVLMREAAASGPAVLLTIWHLMGEKLTDVTPAKFAPKVQKGIRRMRMLGQVATITLRRVEMTEAGQANADRLFLNFRIPVRGHWHGYWMGTGGERRLVKKYVHPYFRGPEDAPIRITKHVTRLSR